MTSDLICALVNSQVLTATCSLADFPPTFGSLEVSFLLVLDSNERRKDSSVCFGKPDVRRQMC